MTQGNDVELDDSYSCHMKFQVFSHQCHRNSRNIKRIEDNSHWFFIGMNVELDSVLEKLILLNQGLDFWVH